MKAVFKSLMFVGALVPTLLSAQVLTPEMKKTIYKDTFIDHEEGRDIDSVRTYQQRDVVPYPKVREADVLWSKRIWREIEVSEKLNLPLYYPLMQIEDRRNLLDIMVQAYKSGNVQAFSNQPRNGDEFVMPITALQADTMFSVTESFQMIDDYGDPYTETTISPLEISDLRRFRIKEDWYFDKQLSQLMVEIIGIMPIFERLDVETGEMKIIGPVWFYMPELRYTLINYEVYNRKNETQRITFDDLFMKRYFSSRIIKEDNVYDRSLAEAGYKGMDQLLEAEGIKKKMFEYEHDLWSY
jgi:gliding motility associated protien GldN